MRKFFSIIVLCCTVFIPLVSSNNKNASLPTLPRNLSGIEIEMDLLDMDAQNLADLNPGWVRFHIKWDLVEISRGKYDWHSDEIERVERILSAAQEVGGIPLITVKAAPEFYRTLPDRCSRPDGKDGAAALGRFILALAKRYDDSQSGLKYFEIWNEPDVPTGIEHQDYLGCFIEQDGAAAAGRYYGSLLNEVAAVIKPKRPDLRLVGPALLGNLEFLNHALAEGGRSIDVISIHHYEAFYSPQEPQYNIQNLEYKFHTIQLFQESHGLNMPLIISEGSLRCAAPEAFTGTTHKCTQFPSFYEQQSEWLRTLDEWVQRRDRVIGYIWYTSQKNGWDDTDLIFSNYERKPVFYEFMRLTSAQARP